jgi:hypothetical protein
MGATTWKLMGTGGAVLTGMLTKKVLTTGWEKATGNPPPANPESPDVSWGEALAWAIVSGALVGVARMLATRKAADYYRRSTGHLPPEMQETT